MQETGLLVGVVVTYTAVAAGMDLWRRRIPNWLTLPTAVAGLAYHSFAPQGSGASLALAGLAVGLSLLLAPFLLGGGGGGDVKLLAALGAWLGPWLTLAAFGLSVVTAATLAIGVLTWQAASVGVARTQRRFAGGAAATAEDRRRRRVLPFALPVALGTWSVLAWLAQQ